MKRNVAVFLSVGLLAIPAFAATSGSVWHNDPFTWFYTQVSRMVPRELSNMTAGRKGDIDRLPGWIIGKEALQQLQSVQTPTALINTFFNHLKTYSNDTSDLPNAIPTETFKSFADFQTAVNNQQIDQTVKAILYDNEHWSFTPPNEQQNPVRYAQKAAALAHVHGLKLIFTPATDLVSVLAPGGTNKYDTFLSLNILGQSAKYVDVVEIQAQGAQGTPEYAAFVDQAVAQIRAVSKTVPIFAGLSSQPQGRSVTSDQLMSDYNATRQYVNGYWLNIPAQSNYCPSCGTGNPPVALAFLESISTSQ